MPRNNSLSLTSWMEPFVPPHRRRIVSQAIIGSLLVHLALFWWFAGTRIGPFAIPFQHEKNPIPFRIKRVEINPEAMQASAHGPSSSMQLPARDPHPLPQFVPPGRDLDRAAQNVRPQINVPALPDVPPVVPGLNGEIPSTASTPYSPSDQAKIESEVSKFETGVNAAGIPNFSANASTTNGTAIASGTGPEGTDGGRGAVPGPSSPGGAPSFEDLKADFKTPDTGLNGRLPEPITLRLPSDVLFDFDSSALKPEAIPLLEQAVTYIKQYPDAKIQVNGYTDSFGEDAYNQALSEARAQTVEKFIQSRLLGSGYHFQVKGFGKTFPLVDPRGSIEAQKKNRRVEIIIQALKS